MGNKYLIKPTHGNANPMELTCGFCGTIFWETKSSAIKKKRVFCSTDCYSNFRRNHLPKEEHNRFGKGLSDDERRKRIKARNILNHAIRDGKIKRLSCFCGKKAEAHHDNYNKPLDVKWFCFKHHRKYHYENPELLEESE